MTDTKRELKMCSQCKTVSSNHNPTGCPAMEYRADHHWLPIEPTEAAGWGNLTDATHGDCGLPLRDHTYTTEKGWHDCPTPEPTADSELCDMANCDIDHGKAPDYDKTATAEGQTWCPHIGGYGPPFTLCEICAGSTDKPDSPELSLSLLVIDLGNCCVVRVEKGSLILAKQHNTELTENGACFCPDTTFEQMKQYVAEMQGNPPVPRLEWFRNGHEINLYARPDEPERKLCLFKTEYDALSALAGHELPVWSGGEWTQLPSAAVDETAEWSQWATEVLHDVHGVTIWRYTY